MTVLSQRARVRRLDVFGSASRSAFDAARSDLDCLGLRQVGETTAKDLARHFGSIDRLLAAAVEQLLEVKDVGRVVVHSIRSFFDQPHNVEVVQQLRAAGIRWPEHEGAA